MDGFNYFAAVSMAVSFFSLMVVIVQLGELIKQRRADAVGRIFAINRQLITLGFSNPELFGILHAEPGSDPRLERAYLQLWLNQVVQIFYTQQRGFLAADLRVSLEADAREPLPVVKKWLGHASLETTAIYLDLIGEEERELAKGGRRPGDAQRGVP
jgi:hypothetical protein